MSEQTTGRPDHHPADAPASPSIEVGAAPFHLADSDDQDLADVRAKPSRTRQIVLSSLLAVGLAGAAVLGYTTWRISSQKDATVTAPESVGNLVVDTSDNGVQSAEYLRTALAAEVDLDETVGAVYKDKGAADQGVLFFGGNGLIWTPGSDLESAFSMVADDQGDVSGIHEVPAGDLGGTMMCGATTADGSDIAVCGWADHGSLALAMFPNRAEDSAVTVLHEIRAAAQTRN
jgi:hypothetical protein